MTAKRIIFLDTSGSSFPSCDRWFFAKKLLKSTLDLKKDLDTFVCLCSGDIRLLTEKELQQLFDIPSATKFFETIKFNPTFSSMKSIMKFFPQEFLKGADVEIISSFDFFDVELEDGVPYLYDNIGSKAEKDLNAFFTDAKNMCTPNSNCVAHLTFYRIDDTLLRLLCKAELQKAEEELEASCTGAKPKEEKPPVTYEPTRKGNKS